MRTPEIAEAGAARADISDRQLLLEPAGEASAAAAAMAAAAATRAPVSKPFSLTGTSALLQTLSRQLREHAEHPSDALRAQAAGTVAQIDQHPQPAKELLSSQWMPPNLQHAYLDGKLQILDLSGDSRLGLCMHFAPGVGWADPDAAYTLNFRGNQAKRVKPGSQAGSLTRLATGQSIEPCVRVMESSLDSGVEGGLIDASTNILMMDLNPLEVDPLSDGMLPAHVSDKDAQEVYIIAQTQRDICLCRLSLARLSVSQQFSNDDLDRISIEYVTTGKMDASFEQAIKRDTTVSPLPMQRYGLSASSPLARSFSTSVETYGTICGVRTLVLNDEIAPHPTQLSSNFPGKAWMRMPNEQRRAFGRLTANLCVRFSGAFASADSADGYWLSYIAKHRNSLEMDQFIVAATTRGQYSSAGIERAALGEFRTKGEGAGSLISDKRITEEQYASMISVEGIRKAEAGIFREAGSGSTERGLSKQQYASLCSSTGYAADPSNDRCAGDPFDGVQRLTGPQREHLPQISFGIFQCCARGTHKY